MVYDDPEVFPYEIEDLEPESNLELTRLSPGQPNGFVRVGPKGYLLPHAYKRLAHQYYTMTLRDSDVFVMGFARSGTNWTQELVWLIVNDLDYKTANSVLLSRRFAVFVWHYLMPPVSQEEVRKINANDPSTMEYLDFLFSGPKTLDSLPSPRFFKTHLALSLLPPKLLDVARAVYVARDPRDVAVSFFHYYRTNSVLTYQGDLKQFWKQFVSDRTCWSPYFENLKEAWALRNHPNMLFIFYEDMIKDLPGVVRRVAQFFGKQYSDEQVAQLCEHLSFDNLKNNPQFNGQERIQIGTLVPDKEKFIRKGKAGGWREVFDAEMRAQADEWIACNLRDTDLRFPSMDN